MGRRAIITKAQIARAVQAAREADPAAVIEVTADGTIRILIAATETGLRPRQ